jgi:hypothetical protein
MVVSEPQKPIAVKSEYLPSRFHCSDKTTNIPRINASRILTIKTLRGKVLNNNGDYVILYLRKAPSIDPTAKNTNSKPFIVYH